MAILLVNACGCVSLELDYLRVIDTNNLYYIGQKQIAGMLIDNVIYPINIAFPEREDILVYLNSTFVEEYGLMGTFIDVPPFFYYSNPTSENFQSAEIMAIMQTDVRRFKLNDPGFEINKPYVSVPDFTTFVEHSSLIGVEILQVQVMTSMTQPKDDDGWSQDPNPLIGKLSFDPANPPVNTYIHVTVKQSFEL